MKTDTPIYVIPDEDVEPMELQHHVEGITDTWLSIPFPTDISQPPYVNLNILRPLIKIINVAAATIRRQGPW